MDNLMWKPRPAEGQQKALDNIAFKRKLAAVRARREMLARQKNREN